MELFSKFKKDYFNYLISIIIPALVNALSIPLFKRLLGSGGYGNFSITFNTILLSCALLTGWISQSCLRYFSSKADSYAFSKEILTLSVITQSIFFLPAFALTFYLTGNFLTAFLCSTSLFIISIQFSAVAISQSIFLSKKSIYAEFFRVTLYIGSAFILLKFTALNYINSLLIAICISYVMSLIYLLKNIRKTVSPTIFKFTTSDSMLATIKLFVNYGGPISIWFVCFYLISITDKYYTLKYFGSNIQGDYQALFDFLSKSITMVISPILISLFPVLTNAYQKNEQSEIKKLITIIVGFEIVAFVVAAILYWWFGAELLFVFIKVQKSEVNKLMGLIVIAATFIWQIAMVVHKRQELQFRSKYLLILIIIAFSTQLLFYTVLKNNASELVFPFGYLLSSLVYLLLVACNFRLPSRKFSTIISLRCKFI